VTYGALSGAPSELSARDLVFNDVTAKGFWLARWFRTTSPAQQAKLFAELAGLVAAGKLSAPIEATYDLSQIKAAVAAAAKGERAARFCSCRTRPEAEPGLATAAGPGPHGWCQIALSSRCNSPSSQVLISSIGSVPNFWSEPRT